MVLVNGRQCKNSELLRKDDLVAVQIAVYPTDHDALSLDATLPTDAIDLDIVYEDDNLLVIDKPKGLSVHPGAGMNGVMKDGIQKKRIGTLVDGLIQHLGERFRNQAWEDRSRAGIVHRLDKDTTGLILCAKDPVTLKALAQQFKAKTNFREYEAMLDGVPKLETGMRSASRAGSFQPTASNRLISIESYLYRDPAHRTRFASLSCGEYAALSLEQRARTRYRWAKSVFSLESVYGDRLCHARVQLHTGRTHQIRVHAKALGAAVLNDPLYHRHQDLPRSFTPEVIRKIKGNQGPFLHAKKLGFTHPHSGVMLSFEAPLPDNFADVLNLLEPLKSFY
jgi:23S rRNA pseudouridine1911/1915/1917 synthase